MKDQELIEVVKRGFLLAAENGGEFALATDGMKFGGNRQRAASTAFSFLLGYLTLSIAESGENPEEFNQKVSFLLGGGRE